MATVGSLNIFMNADTGGLTKGFAEAQRSASRFESFIGKLNAGLNVFGATLGAVGAGRLISFALNAVKVTDDVGDMAERIGVTTEALTQLQYAAVVSGSSVDAIQSALQRMNKTLGDAASGSSEAAQALEGIGLSASALSSVSGSAAFEEIAAQLAKIPSTSGRASAAMRIFGKGAQEILPLLARGKEGIRALADQADRLGVTLDSKAAEAVGRASTAIDKLGQVSDGVQQRFAAGISPAIEEATNLVLRFGLAMDESFTKGGTAAKLLAASVEVLAPTIKAGVAAFDYLDTNLPSLDAAGAPGASAPAMRGMINPVGAAQAKELSDWVKARDAAIAAAAASTEAARKSAEEFTKALEMEVATLGMSTDEAELYRLRLAGVAEADLIYAQSLIKKKKAEEEARKATEDRNAVMEEGRHLTESLMTSEERYAAEVARLNNLLATGAIDRQTYERGIGKAYTESLSGLEMAANDPLRLASSNISRFDTGGGAAALDSAMARNTASNDQKQVKLLEEHNKKLTELIELQKVGGVVVLGPIQGGT